MTKPSTTAPEFTFTPVQHPCPRCGYCPHCGRGGFQPWPVGPYWPWPWYTPYPYTVTWQSPNNAAEMSDSGNYSLRDANSGNYI